jgi:predicted Zn finger-like uncharacterized protein
MANLTLVCPNYKCKAALEVSEALRGQRVKCLRCGQVILVPKGKPSDKEK